MKVFPNRYSGKCGTCNADVAAQAGYVAGERGSWISYCASNQCLPEDVAEEVAKLANPTRELTADGFAVVEPFDRDALPLLRAFPGARWNPTRKAWSVSKKAVDRARVLELAGKLSLDIDPFWHEAATDAGAADFANALVAAETRIQATADAGRPLRDYQNTGVTFFAGRKAALLADDMGLGKTIQALIALPANASAVITCPNSLKWNWYDEGLKWRPDLNFVVCEGRKGWIDPSPGTVVIINYAILPVFLSPKKIKDENGKPVLDRKGKFTYEDVTPEATRVALANAIGIFDEIQKAKNWKAARSKKVTTICTHLGKVWAATGTPLMNRPLDLWGILSALGLNWEVFGSWKTFVRCFNGYHNGYGWEFDGPSGPEVAERLRRVMLRRTKAEVLKDLPPKQYTTLRINGLSKEVYREMDRLLKKWEKTLGAKQLPPFEEFSGLRAKIAAARIPAVIEFIENYEEAGTPLVVFSAHRAPVDTLGEREGWATITGDTPAKERRNIVADFQAGAYKGLALTIQAGGEGLTLTKSSDTLFVDLDWTPALNTQAEDRTHRIGQVNAVNIYRMVSDHDLDRHVTDLLIEKSAIISVAIDGTADYEVPTVPALPEVKDESIEEFQARLAEAGKAAAKAKVAEYISRGKLADASDRPLTDDYSDALRGATNYLLSVCDGANEKDGQGFNKSDAFVAHTILAAGLESDDELRLAEVIIKKYKRQIGDAFPTIYEAA